MSLLDFATSLGLPSASDEALLRQALTHKSFAADTPDEGIPYNERLEFLGDSLLGACVAESLYRQYPDEAESTLTLAKIWLVQEARLAIVARKINLGTHVRLGNGEERSGGRDKDAILADGLEALIAYIYLDHGRESVASFVENYIMSELSDLDDLPGKTRKSRLQEYVQQTWHDLPVYTDMEEEVEDSGNVLSYRSIITVDGQEIAQAVGPSKKKAQEAAAEKAYHLLLS